MIPKSGDRFSDKIMRNEKERSTARIALIENFDLPAPAEAAEHAASVATQGNTP
jgi:hypothetical protein